MFNFQNPFPLGFECKDKLSVIMEWSVLNPGIISAWVILQIEVWLTRKTSSLQWMSGWRWRQVYLVASGLRILHASDNSRLSEWSCTTFKAFLCVFARPPFLSWLPLHCLNSNQKAFYSPIHKPIDLGCFQNNGPLAACILSFFFHLSQLNTSLLLVLFPIPLTLSEAIFKSIVLRWI